MATRRKVNNLLALAVLATVVQQPMHPYEMASVLRERGKDRDMKIKWGSLYTVVANLEKHGLSTATENVRQGGRSGTYGLRHHRCRAHRVGRLGAGVDLDSRARADEVPGRPVRDGRAVAQPRPSALLRRRLEPHCGSGPSGDRALLGRTGTDVPRLFLIEEEYALAIRGRGRLGAWGAG